MNAIPLSATLIRKFIIKETQKKRNRDVILNKAKDHYENDKVGLMKQARHRYRNLSE